MSQSAPQIVHESEAQRQFVRIHLPAKVTLNGETYALRDLSSGGLAVLDITGSFDKGQVVSLELALPFHDFTLDIQLEAQVQNYDASNKIVGARFINLSKQQISLLNHVVKSYIAGDVVNSGDVLSVVARDNFVRVRKQDGSSPASAAPELKRQILPLIFIVLLGVIGAYIIGNSVYQSMFLVKTNDGIVDGELSTITADKDGVYQSSLAEDAVSVKSGDIIGTIQYADGMMGNLVSPCDCFVFASSAKSGQPVTSGQTIFTLAPIEGTATVKVHIDTTSVQRLKMSSIPLISIAGEDVDRTGRILDIRSNLADSAEQASPIAQPPFAYVIIQPDQKIPADLIGRPVQVVFKTY